MKVFFSLFPPHPTPNTSASYSFQRKFPFSQQFKLQTKQYPYFSDINLDKSEILRYYTEKSVLFSFCTIH